MEPIEADAPERVQQDSPLLTPVMLQDNQDIIESERTVHTLQPMQNWPVGRALRIVHIVSSVHHRLNSNIDCMDVVSMSCGTGYRDIKKVVLDEFHS